jgi:Bifunctional DNA primase/polymerase, N-terminal
MVDRMSPLAFAEASSVPIIPVTLSFDDARSKWRKLPQISWDLATTDEATIAGWWQRWPEALPGIPLRTVGWAVVDADTAQGVAAVTGLGPLGPHSAVTTRSGGKHLVFAQPDPPVTKHDWCEGVEVLGGSCLLTCYDLEELLFPRVAPRAVLPKMFWKARGDGLPLPQGNRINKKTRGEGPLPLPVAVGGASDALFALEPKDWRNRHDDWLALMNGAKAAGIERDDFVAWSLGDPYYDGHAELIARKWDSLTPRHAGAFMAALKAARIKLQRTQRNGCSSLFIDEVPSGRGHRSKPAFTPTRDIRDRTNGLLAWLAREPSERRLFDVACVFAEIVAEGRIKVGVATQLLESACGLTGLRKMLGPEEARRTIVNGLRHVEEKSY